MQDGAIKWYDAIPTKTKWYDNIPIKGKSKNVLDQENYANPQESQPSIKALGGTKEEPLQMPEQIITEKKSNIPLADIPLTEKEREIGKNILQPESLSKVNPSAQAFYDAKAIVNQTDALIKGMDDVLSGKVNIGFNAPLAIGRGIEEGIESGIQKYGEAVKSFSEGNYVTGGLEALNATAATVFSAIATGNPVLQAYFAGMQIASNFAPSEVQAIGSPITSLMKPTSKLGQAVTETADTIFNLLVLGYGTKLGKAVIKRYGGIENVPKPVIEHAQELAKQKPQEPAKPIEQPIEKPVETVKPEQVRETPIVESKTDLPLKTDTPVETKVEATDKGQLELGKSFDDILDATAKIVGEKELLRKQKEVVESDRLSSSIPGGNLISKILTKKEPQKIVSSGNTKFDNQFIPREDGGLSSSTKRATEFLRTVKDAFTYLSKVKNDPNISPEMFNEIKLEVSILKDDISQKLKSKVDKVSYAIFGDMPNIEIDQLNLGKYAGAKRLEAIYNNPEMSAQQGKLGYTKENIGQVVKNLDKNLSPQVKESYDRMRNILDKYGEELVSEGLIEKAQDNYFPFRVLDFIDQFALGRGRLGKIEPGSSKKFGGTEKPYDIDALSVLREYTIQNEKARAFNKAEKNLLQKFNQPEKVTEEGTPLKGYSEYYFDPKRNYFKAYAFGKKAMEDLLSGNLPDDMSSAVKEILAVGKKKGERYIIPDGLSKTLNDFYGEIVHKNIPVLGSMTTWWKRNMTSRLGIFTAQFHARNMRSDLARIANNYPKSLAYKEFGDFLQSKLNLTQRGWIHFIETVGGKKITDLSRAVVSKEKFSPEKLTEIYKEAVEQGELFGLLGTEAYTVSERSLKNTFTKEGIRKRVGEVKEGMGLTKALDKFDQVSTAREAIPRFQLYAYLRLVEKQTRAKAHAEVGKTLINYNEFTPFEKTWMSGFAYPFWSWRKGNIETTARSLKEGTTAQRTRIVGSIAASSLLPTLWNYWTDPEAEEKLQNDKSKRYIADNLHINTGLKDGNGNPIYIYDQTWSDDITRFTNIQGLIDKGIKINADQLGVGQAILDYGLETVGTDVNDIVQEVNPNIKMPFEVVANKGFYYGYPIYKEGDNNLEKLGKIALYGAKTENRNLSTFINLFVGQQDPTMKGLRISGLPITSTNLNKSETNLELFTNAIFKERLKEITDQTKTVKELKAKALQSGDPEDKKKYNEANQALVIMRKNSPAYKEKLKLDRKKQKEQDEILGKKKTKIKIY